MRYFFEDCRGEHIRDISVETRGRKAGKRVLNELSISVEIYHTCSNYRYITVLMLQFKYKHFRERSFYYIVSHPCCKHVNDRKPKLYTSTSLYKTGRNVIIYYT